MKHILKCKKCSEDIITDYVIKLKDGKTIGLWSLPKRSRMSNEYEIFCGYCDTEGDAE